MVLPQSINWEIEPARDVDESVCKYFTNVMNEEALYTPSCNVVNK